MPDITIKRIEDLEPYHGPNAIEGIRFRNASGPLGFAAWELNVLDLDPHCSGYPEHDHAKEGTDEVYVMLGGSATIHVGDIELPVEAGTLIRVGAQVRRKFVAGPEGASILAI